MIFVPDSGGSALLLAMVGVGPRCGAARLGTMIFFVVSHHRFLWTFPGLPTAAGRVNRDPRGIGGNSL